MIIKYSKEVLHSFTIITLFFFISAFTTEMYFTLSSIILSTYVILFTLYKKASKKILTIYLIFISLLLLPVILGYSGVRPGNWMGLAISFMAYFLFSDYLNKRPYIVLPLSKILYYSYLTFLSVLLVITYILNVSYGDFINKIFTNTSRNVVIYFCFILCIVYIFSTIINKEKINFASLIYFCFFCLISGSRTALILSVSILLICLIKNIRVMILLFAFSLLIFIFIDNIELYILSHTNFNQGLETPRTSMYNEYIEKLSFFNFLLGMNLDILPTVFLYGSNPHNTFIYVNMLFGFNVIIYIFMLLYSTYNYSKVDIRLSLIFLVLILRLTLDTVSYNNFFTDIFILYFIMNSFTLKKKQQKEIAPLHYTPIV